MGISETWLKDHNDAEVHIDGYKIFRSDRARERKSKRGRESGGVACYVRNDIASTCENIFSYSNGVIEIVCVYSRIENLVILSDYHDIVRSF